MKKQIYTTLSAFVMGMAICVQAQNYDDYNLKSYKTPDIKRNALDFNFNSDGGFVTNPGSNNNTFDIKGLINSSFKRDINTRHFIGEQQVNLDLSGSNMGLNSISNSKRRNLSSTFQYENSSRFYISDKWFWNTGGNVYFNYDNIKGASDPVYSTLNFNVSPTIGLGKGRIESVRDARQAIYILDNLSKKGVITTKLSEEEINRFSQIISTVKNKRFLDARIHLIDEITQVDSFLIENNYLKKTGASYFTTLYDYWQYGDLFARGAGLEFCANLNPFYVYSNMHPNGTKYVQSGISAKFLVNYEDPINLYWQQSANASVILGYNHNSMTFDDTKSSGNERSGLFLGNYGIGYYPNSRTNLNIGVSEQFRLSNNSISDKTFYTSSTSLVFSTYYYISPQLRLSGNVNLAYNDSNDYNLNYDRWNGYYSMTFTYSLF
ncbi:hypothetical protein [uncultured Bacteroides sp.]|uniref:hypothetical protein n=1 Tax=uncultured Bacteroides sp. TaxID=162156 RepID=UPI002AA644B5|nr:hypothetical protein [uncultured Bacteroides sp.]